MSKIETRDLAERESGPMPDRRLYAPGPDGLQAYFRAWQLWRAIRRDAQLTDAELCARFDVVEAHIRARIVARGRS